MAVTMQKWTLKIECGGEVRRLRDWPEHDVEPSARTLRSAIAGLFELSPSQQEVLSIKYMDDEGDMCTLVETSISDALSFATQRGVLRLMATCGQSVAVEESQPSEVEIFTPVAVEESQPVEEDDEEEEFTPVDVEVSQASEAETSGPVAVAESEPSEAEAYQLPEAEPEAETFMPAAVEASQPSEVETFSLCGDDTLQDTEEAFRESETEATEETEEAADEESSVQDYINSVADELQCDVSDRLSEARRIVSERLEDSRPHVDESFAYFKKQVVDDFQSTSRDMKDAFGTNEPQCRLGQDAFGLVRGVVGTAAGVVAAARLAPIHATRLAAHSAAAVAGKDVTTVSTDSATDSESVPEEGTATEFERFKQQVKNDFRSSRREVSAAFSCILGETDSASSEAASSNEPAVEQDDEQAEPQLAKRQSLKVAVPRVVSLFVGVSAAMCLLPIRGARLAVAELSHAAAPSAQAEDLSQQEAVPSEEALAAP